MRDPGRPIRVVVAKAGLDGHDRGAKVVARSLRDAGMEVIYTGLRQTPEQIVAAALQEDADVIGLSILSGAHMTLVPRVVERLAEQGAEDVVITVGGTIPADDIGELKRLGVAEVPRRALAEAREPIGGLGVRPTAARRRPARRREVMEGDDRRDAARAARAAHAEVMIERRGRELAVLGLDPAPLEREAVRPVAVTRREREVLVEPLVMEAGVAAHGAVGDHARLMLESPPVVVRVAAFDLVGRGGGAPEEAGREAAIARARAVGHRRKVAGRREAHRAVRRGGGPAA